MDFISLGLVINPVEKQGKTITQRFYTGANLETLFEICVWLEKHLVFIRPRKEKLNHLHFI